MCVKRGSVGLALAVAVSAAALSMGIYDLVLITSESDDLNEVFTAVASVATIFAAALWAAIAVLIAAGVGRGFRAIWHSSGLEMIGRGIGALLAADGGLLVLRSLFGPNPTIALIVVALLSILFVVVVPNLVGRRETASTS